MKLANNLDYEEDYDSTPVVDFLEEWWKALS